MLASPYSSPRQFMSQMARWHPGTGSGMFGAAVHFTWPYNGLTVQVPCKRQESQQESLPQRLPAINAVGLTDHSSHDHSRPPEGHEDPRGGYVLKNGRESKLR